MAQTNLVGGTFTANGNSDALCLQAGGVVSCDLVWTAGTLTVKPQVSVDDGTTWVDACDNNGAAISYDMATGLRHARFEFAALAGNQYRLNASSASSANVQYRLGRAVWQ